MTPFPTVPTSSSNFWQMNAGAQLMQAFAQKMSATYPAPAQSAAGLQKKAFMPWRRLFFAPGPDIRASRQNTDANATPTRIVAPPKRKYTHRHEPNRERITATSAPETSIPVYIAPWWRESAVVRVVLCSSAISA